MTSRDMLDGNMTVVQTGIINTVGHYIAEAVGVVDHQRLQLAAPVRIAVPAAVGVEVVRPQERGVVEQVKVDPFVEVPFDIGAQ